MDKTRYTVLEKATSDQSQKKMGENPLNTYYIC